MRKTFWINDDSVLKYIESQKNQSKYITDLIRKDMMCDKREINIRESFEQNIINTIGGINKQIEIIRKACIANDKNFFNKS